MKKPVVAAVQGHVLGGGCELVMLCDMTIAADNATFGEPEVRFWAVGPAIVMPMIIGYKKARELLYFGDQIDAKTALDLGMVNRVVPLAELREVSLKFAKRLSLISPEALYATKRAVNRVADAAGFRTALYAGLDVVGPLYATTTELGARFRQIATYEKMYNGSRSRPALERGVTQADESRRRGVIMEAIVGVDIAVWDAKAQALGIPLYRALGAVRSSVRGYASGGWAPGDEAEAE